MLVRLLLSGAALTAGVALGLIPALLLGMALDLVPKPHFLSSRRGVPVAPAGARVVPGQMASTPAVGPVFVPTFTGRARSLTAGLPLSVQPRADVEPALHEGPDAIAARERRRRLYDEEYSKQLRHLDTLRRTITTRLAVPADALADDPPSNGGSPPAASDG
jgi:hypothetical protein